MLAVSWREDSLERAETLAAVKSAKKVSLDAGNGLTDAQHSGPACACACACAIQYC